MPAADVPISFRRAHSCNRDRSITASRKIARSNLAITTAVQTTPGPRGDILPPPSPPQRSRQCPIRQCGAPASGLGPPVTRPRLRTRPPPPRCLRRLPLDAVCPRGLTAALAEALMARRQQPDRRAHLEHLADYPRASAPTPAHHAPPPTRLSPAARTATTHDPRLTRRTLALLLRLPQVFSAWLVSAGSARPSARASLPYVEVAPSAKSSASAPAPQRWRESRFTTTCW